MTILLHQFKFLTRQEYSFWCFNHSDPILFNLFIKDDGDVLQIALADDIEFFMVVNSMFSYQFKYKKKVM